MAYKWNGTAKEVEDEPKPARTGPLRKFDPSACGTYAGYARHLRYKVIPCQGCRAAMAAYSRSRYTKRAPDPPASPRPTELLTVKAGRPVNPQPVG